jgi:hypothetical protein
MRKDVIIYIIHLFLFQKSIRFLKMDKNKCPKWETQNTFLKISYKKRLVTIMLSKIFFCVKIPNDTFYIYFAEKDLATFSVTYK